MSYTDRKCQSLCRFLLGPFCQDIFAHHFLLFLCSFTCSVSQSPSVFPSFPLLCCGMCISAVSDERVVNKALPCACVCVYIFRVRTCISLPNETGDKFCQLGEKRDRHTGMGWSASTGITLAELKLCNIRLRSVRCAKKCGL